MSKREAIEKIQELIRELRIDRDRLTDTAIIESATTRILKLNMMIADLKKARAVDVAQIVECAHLEMDAHLQDIADQLHSVGL